MVVRTSTEHQEAVIKVNRNNFARIGIDFEK